MTSNDHASAISNRRLLLFTGKGGVGKTTMVAAIAMHAASMGMRPLVVELGHRASMRSVFAVDDIGFKPRDVGRGVHALSIDVDLAVLDYMLEHVPSKRIARSIMSNRVLERLFSAMPAVGEIATLNKLRALEAETLPGGAHRFAPILIDLDATGHALMFLELRNVLEHILGAGPMRRLVESTADMIADPVVSRLHLVTTPEELPVTETIELHRRLEAAGTVAFGSVYVNRVPNVGFDRGTGEVLEAELAAIERAASAIDADDVRADVAFGRIALAQARRAEEQIARLREHVDLPLTLLPRLHAERMSDEQLLHLGALAAGPGGGGP